GDFATEADLSVERQLRTLLTQYTGLPVHGEEFGTVRPGEIPGENITEPNPNDAMADGLDGPRRKSLEAGDQELPETFWVVDPIDGTANYAVGNPFACILVSLVHQGQTMVSVTEMPLL
ncbi:inositol monophosphatase, partial [Kytococcus schroeteri]